MTLPSVPISESTRNPTQIDNGNTYRFYASSTSVDRGVKYQYDVVTSCSLDLIDFDGAFWDLATGRADDLILELEDYRSPDGVVHGYVEKDTDFRGRFGVVGYGTLELRRHGPTKIGNLCA